MSVTGELKFANSFRKVAKFAMTWFFFFPNLLVANLTIIMGEPSYLKNWEKGHWPPKNQTTS